ncbi:ParB-like protein [Eubacterium saphenum ATCC 49989]|nr:ParB-like protein [Eubacterium saphenum ATCC 49989]
MAERKGLGKGLGALFEDVNIDSTEIEGSEANKEDINFIEIDEIAPNESQPRKTFNKEKLEELARSIKTHGVIQPIVVRKQGSHYEVVAGERRWRAARIAGLSEVPCIVRELTDEQNMLVAIIENVQREDLNPIEEARGIRAMIEDYELTQDEVAKAVSKSRPYITNALRMLKLPDAVLDMVSAGKLSAGHARAILSAKEEEQTEIAKHVETKGLSVREAEKLSKKGLSFDRKKPGKHPTKNAAVKQIESELSSALGTKVNLSQNGNKGKIEIEYYSREELEGLIEALRAI